MVELRTAGWRPTLVAILLAAIIGWGAVAQAQNITEFQIPTSASAPAEITLGPDGNLWFTENRRDQIGRITPSGAITEFSLGSLSSPIGITTGPDGNLWFTEFGTDNIGRITPGGTITEFALTRGAKPYGITAGPDGNLWFAENGANRIGRISTGGTVAEFPLPADSQEPTGITQGPDGALWFTIFGLNSSSNAIGRITTAGVITQFSLPTGGARPEGIVTAPDGTLWFTESSGNRIGSITTSGVITEFPAAASRPMQIAVGPDGALWVAQESSNSLSRITTNGTQNDFALPAFDSRPTGIVGGPDGAVWFTEFGNNKIGRITAPSISNAVVAAVLPASRSIVVGGTATAFATIVNSTGAALNGCTITPLTPVPAGFLYQTTNPRTNALTGTPNTPVSIGANASQSFLIALTATATQTPIQVRFGFNCGGAPAAAITTGVDTLLYSASSSAVPDIVALAATVQNDGILHITGTNGSSAFAVASVNVGASGAITVSANTGSATLPLNLMLCQTNPTSGQCLGPPAASVSTTINANATPTFGIFGTASGAIAFLPATNRIFVQFRDANGVVRGATSVAVQTQ